MTYREQLDKVNELGIDILDLTVANELFCVLDCEYTEKDFERLCEYAKYIYLKAEDITAEAIAQAINDLLVEGKSVDDVVALEKWAFIDKASYYI